MFAVLFAVVGHWAAFEVPALFGLRDTETSGMMATVAGAFFAGTLVVAPRYGLVARLTHRARLAVRVVREDVLGTLYRARERDGREVLGVAALSEAMGRKVTLSALVTMRMKGEILRGPEGYSLSRKGLHRAREIIRAHRLWEGFLVEEAGAEPERVHQTAERLEHVTDADLRAELFRAAGSPTHDPHHREIPPEDENDT